jgi:hypothetical protein
MIFFDIFATKRVEILDIDCLWSCKHLNDLIDLIDFAALIPALAGAPLVWHQLLPPP